MILLQLLVKNGTVTSSLKVNLFTWECKKCRKKIDYSFDLHFYKDLFSLIETKMKGKIRKRIEVLTKHKEHLVESSMYPWI